MEEGCSYCGVADDIEASVVGCFGDCGHVEDEAVGVAGCFDVDIDFSALLEAVFVFFCGGVEGFDEVLEGVAVEEFDGDIEV